MTNTRPRVVSDGHYSFQEAADLLGIDRRTIYRWRKMGYIPVTKPRRTNGRSYILGKYILRAFDAVC